MKHILLLAVMLALTFGSSVARVERGTNSVLAANAADVEGVILNKQKARVKPGYQFERESSKSVGVFKISNTARFQTGTITCTGRQGLICEAFVSKSQAACNGGCYFVGVRGAPRAQ
ncbi:MAG: hypothetical protein H0W99_10295 [Acidobacteria bacterium]|nr:hypothetical protein [Acidobacteriota bacterium]